MRRGVKTFAVIFVSCFLVAQAVCAPKASSSSSTRAKSPELTATLELNPAAISKRLEAVLADESLAPAVREWTSVTLSRARDALAEAAASESQLAAYREAIVSATTRTAELRQRLRGVAPPETTVPSAADTAALTRLLAEAEAEVDKRQQQLQQLRQELTNRQQRKAVLPQEIVETRQRIEALDADQIVPPSPDPSAGWDTIRKVAREALALAARRKLEMLENEQRMLEATEELANLRVEEAEQLLERARRRLTLVQEALAARRQQEAQEAIRQAERARWETANSHPLIKEIAADNETIARRRTGPDGLPARLVTITNELDTVRRQRDQIRQRFEAMKKRLEVLGRSDVVGQLMRKERNDLPPLRPIARALQQYAAEIAVVQGELMDLREKRAEVPALETKLRSLLATKMRFSTDETSAIVNELLAQRRALLDASISDLDQLFSKLTELTAAFSLYLEDTSNYAQFLDEHILWVRSTKPYSLADLSRAREACYETFSASLLLGLSSFVLDDFVSSPATYLVVLTFALFGGWWSHRVRPLWIEATREAVAAGGRRPLASQLNALAYLFVASAAPLPVLAAYLGQRMMSSVSAAPAIVSFGRGLFVASAIWWFTFLIAHVCRAASSFGLPAFWTACRRAATQFGLLLSLAVLLVFAAQDVVPQAKAEALERTLFLLVVFYAVLLGAQLAWRTRSCEAQTSQWPLFDRRVLFPTAVLALAGLLLLLFLSAAGYHYSALQLLKRSVQTMGLAIVAGLVYRLVIIWLTRLAHAHASLFSPMRFVGPRHAPTASHSTAAEPPTDGTVWLHQVRRMSVVLIGFAWLVGVAALWSDMVPALSMLARYPLWQRSSDQASAPVSSVVVGDLISALLIAAVCVVVVRNIAGLVELLLVRFSKLDSGTRYAVTALLRYAILILGIVEMSRLLGVSWRSVQWIAAAVTVGLGFGLQEIFANFVSGLILLFERPVRVGDWVTVGETTGLVTHIRTRATTIRDPDGKELLVPNKLLITGSVKNWTLSDTITRLTVEIRVAGPGEVDELKSFLLAIASRHPLVVSSPPPSVHFEGMTGEELRFRLSVFTERVDRRLLLEDELLTALRQKLKERGLSIALLDCPS